MNATKLLEQQHRQVEVLFGELRAAKSDASRLLEDLANDLASHMAIEQNIFYPAIREVNPELVDESFEEHAIAEIALKRLLRTPPSDPSFDARLSTLEDLVEHHVEEEEEYLFPAVEKALTRENLESLGARMEDAFAAAKGEGFMALVPRGFAQTSSDEARKAVAQAAHSANGRSATPRG